MTALEKLAAALGERVKLRRQDGFQAQCPAHADGRASLAVKQGEKGAVMKCHAGCDIKDIVEALKLKVGDLFDEPLAKEGRGKIVAAYQYVDEHGALLYEVVRFEPKDFRQRRPNGNGWTWSLGDVRQVPYHLPELLRSAPRGVFIVEGEKDVHALQGWGLIATTNSGGAGKWRAEFAPYLKGRTVVILPDNDAPGRKHAKDVMEKLGGVAESCIIVELPGLPPGGDVSDWIVTGGTREQLLALCRTPPKNPLRARLEKLRADVDAILGSIA